MIERISNVPVAVGSSLQQRQDAIKRLSDEMRLIFGTWALTAGLPPDVAFVEAAGDVIVIDRPEPTDG